TVHVRVAARLPDSSSANMVVVLAKIPAFLEHGVALDGRQSRCVDAQGLAAGVHFDGGDLLPVLRRLPILSLEELSHALKSEPGAVATGPSLQSIAFGSRRDPVATAPGSDFKTESRFETRESASRIEKTSGGLILMTL